MEPFFVFFGQDEQGKFWYPVTDRNKVAFFYRSVLLGGHFPPLSPTHLYVYLSIHAYT
jgi:hypothetical protein